MGATRLSAVLSFVALSLLARGAGCEELTVPGSGNPEYVLGQLAKAFNARQARHTVTVPPSIGTAGAIREISEATASLARVGRPLKAEELGRGLVYVPLGRDPVVFVAGAGVSVRSITRAQVTDVYTGKITDWRELGGSAGPIRAVGREVTDASRQAVNRELVPFQTIRFHEDVKVVHLDPQMIGLLDRFPTSLGFINRSAIGAATTRLVPLALDSVDATSANLAAGRYPLWLEIGLIHRRGGLTGAGREFLAFVGSADGDRILRAHGVVPVPPPR